MNFIIFLSMYMYVLRKIYEDFKDSQIAINESLREDRYMELASIRTQALLVVIKLAYEI